MTFDFSISLFSEQQNFFRRLKAAEVAQRD